MGRLIFGYKLPYFLSKRLFGDRRKFGLTIQENDPCWQELNKNYMHFYNDTQKQSVGSIVNDSGYQVVQKVNLKDKVVLEVGPGNLDHIKYWGNKPKHFYALDVNEEFLSEAKKVLVDKEISHSTILQTEEVKSKIPMDNDSVDIIFSFYSLEHLHPLDEYLQEMKRILKPGGMLIGAIPTEGGFGWGLGRALTSRRWLKKHTNINPDKIICWAHPNFSNMILDKLNKYFKQNYLSYWPFKIPLLDFNLVVKFIFIND